MMKVSMQMKISIKSIVSNSDMIKTYKTCREKAEETGRLFIFKNNQADAVLFSISEYAKVAPFVEYMDTHDEEEVAKLIQSFQKKHGHDEYPGEKSVSELQ